MAYLSTFDSKLFKGSNAWRQWSETISSVLVQFLANQNLQSYINLKNFFWKKKPSLLKLKWSARLHVSWNSLYIQLTVNKNVQTSNTVNNLKKIHSWIYHWLCVQSFQNGTEKPEKRQSKTKPITVHSYSTFFFKISKLATRKCTYFTYKYQNNSLARCQGHFLIQYKKYLKQSWIFLIFCPMKEQ